PEDFAGVSVQRVGEQSAGSASEILANSAAAFLDYPVEFLSKSGAFAAVCAHGALPVCRARRQGPAPAPGEGERWLSIEGLAEVPSARRSRVAAAARRWYQGHSIERHVALWLEAFGR